MKTVTLVFAALLLVACGKREDYTPRVSVDAPTPVITKSGTIECR